MFRLIFFTQAIIYLLIMPAIHDYMDLAYRAPLVLSIIAIFALAAGFAAYNFICPELSKNHRARNVTIRKNLKAREISPFGIAILTVFYIYVSATNGLWNRRQGSEVMADLYGNLPLLELAILRVYEITFIPIAVVYIFGDNSRLSRFCVMSFLAISLPFMGVQDSRARMLVIAMCLLSFINVGNFRSFLVKNTKIFLFLILSIGFLIYVSAKRLSGYSRVEDYLFNEVVRRLDGLNLVSELRDYGYINYLGSFDFAMFSPLVSRVPFIDAGRIAKIEGVTSTKQYFLKSIINTSRLDESNSMILDPLYLGGLFGLVFAFLFLGYLIAGFDRYVTEGRLFSSYAKLALLLAFITSFVTIEVDFFGALTSVIQSSVVLLPVLWMMLYRPTANQNLSKMAD